MKELQLLLKLFFGREIDLAGLKEGYGKLLERDPELAATSAAWLDAGERDGLLSDAVCSALKSVLVQHMAATNLGPNPKDSGIFAALEMDGEKADAATSEEESSSEKSAGEPADETFVRDPDATEMGSVEDVAGRQAEDSGPLQIGSIIGGRYELLSQLGAGGMGRVYKARDRLREEAQDRNPHVALKVLSEEFKLHPDSMIALQREVRRAQTLAHPNVITVHEFFRDGPHLYMTMELLEGEALDRLCKTDYAGGIAYEAAWRIVEGVCRALQYGHDKGIVHSDIKPGNIFVCDDGTIKVLDLGISRPMTPSDATESEKTVFDPGTRLGSLTPAYAALEMWYQETPDPRDDIYALACMTYLLISGRHPFDGTSAREANEKGMVPERIEGLSRGQWGGLLKGLAFKREDRTVSVDKFRRELEPQAIVRRNRRYAMAAAAAVILIASLVGIQYYTGVVEERTMDDAAAMEGGNGATVSEAERPELSPEEIEQFDRLLQLSDLQFSMVTDQSTPDELAYLLSQGPNNVVALANTILDVDPGYPAALAAKERAHDLFVAHAERLERQEAYAEAIALVGYAVEVLPSTPQLLRLRRDICEQAPEVCATP